MGDAKVNTGGCVKKTMGGPGLEDLKRRAARRCIMIMTNENNTSQTCPDCENTRFRQTLLLKGKTEEEINELTLPVGNQSPTEAIQRAKQRNAQKRQARQLPEAFHEPTTPTAPLATFDRLKDRLQHIKYRKSQPGEQPRCNCCHIPPFHPSNHQHVCHLPLDHPARLLAQQAPTPTVQPPTPPPTPPTNNDDHPPAGSPPPAKKQKRDRKGGSTDAETAAAAAGALAAPAGEQQQQQRQSGTAKKESAFTAKRCPCCGTLWDRDIAAARCILLCGLWWLAGLPGRPPMMAFRSEEEKELRGLLKELTILMRELKAAYKAYDAERARRSTLARDPSKRALLAVVARIDALTIPAHVSCTEQADEQPSAHHRTQFLQQHPHLTGLLDKVDQKAQAVWAKAEDARNA